MKYFKYFAVLILLLNRSTSLDVVQPLAFFEPDPILVESADSEVAYSDLAIECARNLIQKGLIGQSKLPQLQITELEFDSMMDEFWLNQELPAESNRINFNASLNSDSIYYGQYYVRFELLSADSKKQVQCSMSEEDPGPPDCDRQEHYHGSLYNPDDQEIVKLTSQTNCGMARQ